MSVFMEYPLKQNYVGDTLYGIPCYTDSYAICYNKAVFDKYGVEYPKEGWNWNDYEALAEELNLKSRQKEAMSLHPHLLSMNRLMVRFCC